MFKLSRTDPTHNPNVGHGHVYPRPDGAIAKCGGPNICGKCAVDLAHALRHEADKREAEQEQRNPHTEGLRELRLWHWNEFVALRAVQRSWEKERYEVTARYYEAKANFHMKAVQTLNDFFPAGDTAEQDAAK